MIVPQNVTAFSKRPQRLEQHGCQTPEMGFFPTSTGGIPHMECASLDSKRRRQNGRVRFQAIRIGVHRFFASLQDDKSNCLANFTYRALMANSCG